MLLHNFLVDEREDESYFANFDAQVMYEDADSSDVWMGETLIPHVLENDVDRPQGRPLFYNLDFRVRGSHIRDDLAQHLHNNGLRRPRKPGWKRNKFGHIYFVGNDETRNEDDF
jgi:hypothetical protein